MSKNIVSDDIKPYLSGYEGRRFIWEPPPLYTEQQEFRVRQAINPRLPFLNTKRDVAIHDLFYPDKDILVRPSGTGKKVGVFMGRNVVQSSPKKNDGKTSGVSDPKGRTKKLPTIKR